MVWLLLSLVLSQAADLSGVTHSDAVPTEIAAPVAAKVAPGGVRATANATGELVVTGRHVTRGYWRAPSETAMRFRDYEGQRELVTGDICRLDEEGRIYVLGRRDSIIKHRGVRMSLLEVEQAAVEVAGVLEAAAVKTSDNALHLFVSGTPDLNPAEVNAQLEKQLEWNKLPDKLHVAPDFPRASTGKVDRKAITASAADVHHPRPPAP